MKKTTTRAIAASVLVGALGIVGLSPATSSATPGQAKGDAPALFTVDRSTSSTERSASKAEPVDVAADLLAPGSDVEVSMDLPSGDLDVSLTPIDDPSEGWSAWSGTVDGDPAASATVVRNGDDVSALISSPEGTYRIRNTGPGTHVTEAVERTFPEGPDTVDVPEADDLGGLAPAPVPSGDAAPSADAETSAAVPTYPVVDVLVAYTPAALADAGSLATLNSEINLSISTTNTAYSNSGVSGRVRLAGTYATGVNLSLSTQSLYDITGTSDGVADGVHARRNAVGADLVSVFVSDPSSCGLAWVQQSLGNTDRAYGFSLVEFGCAVDNLSFPHELGHNMGLNHDHYVEDEGGELFPYGYGYVNLSATPANRWRTIMAYNNECSAAGYNCTRLARFSNPNQSYNGQALGRAYNGSNPADNRRALNNSQSSIAVYRANTAPFSTWTKFVAQQYRDFLGRNPTNSESASAVSALDSGAYTPEAFVSFLLNGTFASENSPVARLYFAYFLRAPEMAGLDYWVNRMRNGASLIRVSSSFVESPEFVDTYGPLTNRQFVELVYDNVLGRPGEEDGIVYWTNQLNTRKKTRGKVMIGFSESPEFRVVRSEEINVVLIYRSMLQRSPSSGEFGSEVARLEGGTTVSRLLIETLASAEYAGRITP